MANRLLTILRAVAPFCFVLLASCAGDQSLSHPQAVTLDAGETQPDRAVDSSNHAARGVEHTSTLDGALVETGLQTDPQSDTLRSADAATDASRPVRPRPSALDAGPTHANTDDARPLIPTDGEPLQAAEGQWTYLEFPNTQCRDGSPAGLAVSLHGGSKKLMIFLEGGGVCQDPATCLINPANTSDQRAVQHDGVFDRKNAQNPVKDWNFVYVPYCTGDMHAGANPQGMVANVGPQKFVGYLNLQKFLERVVPTFPGVTDVLLTGVSAGGFGASQSAPMVQRAFPDVKVRVVSDSAPQLSKAVIPECLQDIYRTDWELEQTYLAECGADCPNKSDFLQDYALFVAKTFADRASGLIESSRDRTVADYFGIGSNGCTGVLYLTPVPGDTFQAALLALRDALAPYPSFSTYFPAGTQHMWLNDPSFYTSSAGGVKLVDWFGKIAVNQVPGNSGP
jgi:hypothetical protein